MQKLGELPEVARLGAGLAAFPPTDGVGNDSERGSEFLPWHAEATAGVADQVGPLSVVAFGGCAHRVPSPSPVYGKRRVRKSQSPPKRRQRDAFFDVLSGLCLDFVVLQVCNYNIVVENAPERREFPNDKSSDLPVDETGGIVEDLVAEPFVTPDDTALLPKQEEVVVRAHPVNRRRRERGGPVLGRGVRLSQILGWEAATRLRDADRKALKESSAATRRDASARRRLGSRILSATEDT